MTRPAQRLTTTDPHRWTVIVRNPRGQIIGTWLDVKAKSAAEAIRSVWQHNMSKADRMYVCEAVAYQQPHAHVWHCRPEQTLTIEGFTEEEYP